MKTETFLFSGYNDKTLPAMLWQPEGETKALLQITHGMTEHIGRYEALARKMTAQGIAVAGFDLRGHGRNSGDKEVASFGKGGWEATIGDMKRFYDLLEERFPGVPHYLHGFSLGSFLLREYLGYYPEDGAGAVILGTGNQPAWLLSIMMGIVKGQIKKAGFDGYSPLVRQLSFGTYNQKFKPHRTQKDWLCSDNETIDEFIADPLCRENFSTGLFYQMLSAMKRTGGNDIYDTWDKEKPILLICGEKDPVGNMGKGAKSVMQAMKQAGLDVTFHLLSGSRHMILGEQSSGAADTAVKIIQEWILR
ncbi:MAG: alpha/beta fold hydrolase [Oscillospiraceae bacterium]|nr:alpha/beta fold hydrolase [Oscillospiraceae bacterium]